MSLCCFLDKPLNNWFLSFHSALLFFDHRACAACWAISFFLLGDSFSALAFPPFNPPILPSKTAAGFFPSSMAFISSSVALSIIKEANLLRSLGTLLKRLGIQPLWFMV